MSCKQIHIRIILLALVLVATLATGCAPKGAEPVPTEKVSDGTAQSKDNSFDYGITVNVPKDWNGDSYRATTEENPKYDYDIDYPLLYGVHYDYINKEGETYKLFSIYVFNAVDWNEFSLSLGDAPRRSYQIKRDDNFAYAVGNLPSENPFSEDPDGGVEFGDRSMFIWDTIQNDPDRIFVIETTDRKPTVTESRNKTVKCDYGFFTLNIPSTWIYDDLHISYSSKAEYQGYEAEYMAQYALKTGPDSTDDLFATYLFDNEVWARLETDANGASMPISKIAENDSYTLAVWIAQESTLDSNSDIGKKYMQMLESVHNFNDFFELN